MAGEHVAEETQRQGHRRAQACQLLLGEGDLHLGRLVRPAPGVPGGDEQGVGMAGVEFLEGRDDKVAVHAVCRENVFWETLEELKKAGASSMLVLPVEKMLS